MPPTINKYYVLDLAPGRSLVEYLVQQGQQVFVISWRNPDARHADWGLETYVQAVLDALGAVERISASDRTALVGFCSGGIIASIAAAHLAGTGQQSRLAALGLGVTVLDNARANRASALVDRRLAAVAKATSSRRGYLDGRALAEVFAWLRPGDLIWNYWVNNYLLGKKPPAFDLLFWNADTTRMPARLHADFVDLAIENHLVTPGALTTLGDPFSLSRVDVDAYVIAGIADHLTPWQNCYRGTQLLGGQSRFILSTSGHIAALVNPPGNPKASYPDQRAQPGRSTAVARGCGDPAGQLVAGPDRLAGRALRAREAGAPTARPPWPAAARRRARHLRLRPLREDAVYEGIGRSLGTDYFRIADQLTSEERGYLRRTRDFVDDQVLPVINGYWERAEFPWPLIEQLAKLEIVGDGIQGYGCPPMSPIAAGLVNMELNRGDGSLGTFLGVQAGLAMQSIAMLGSEEQKQRWLPPMATLEKLGAFALTEPLHGSDSVALETSVRRDGDEWVINGQKKWIGNGTLADVVVVWARDVADGQVKGFLVEKGAPGYDARRMDAKGSLRAVWQAEITLTEVRVPEEHRLPGASSFKDAGRVLAGTRNTVAWGALGHATAAYEVAVAYCRQRRAVRQAAGELPDRAGQAGQDARRGLLDAAVLPRPLPRSAAAGCATAAARAPSWPRCTRTSVGAGAGGSRPSTGRHRERPANRG